MSGCANLDAYLDRRLSSSDATVFERHLKGCESCQAEVTAWRRVETELKGWAGTQGPSAVELQAAADRLVRRARHPGADRPERRLAWGLGFGLAAAAATVIAIVVVSQLGRESKRPRVLSVLRGEGGVAREARGAILQGDSEGLLARVGPDTVGVSRHGRVEVLEAVESRTRLRLHAGSVALQVQHRTHGETVDIEARDLTVRVVGTRFMVTVTPEGAVQVGVREGKVRVTAASGRSVFVEGGEAVWSPSASSLELAKLSAGEARGLDELLAPEPPVTAAEPTAARPVDSSRPSLSTVPQLKAKERLPSRDSGRATADEVAAWQKQVLAGDYDGAERALSQHLKGAPKDGEAWSLLGDCRRKAGRFKDAVRAYRQVVRVGEGAQANRARLLAASVLQDDLADPAAAEPLLRAYLAASPTLRPLEAAAEVRLGRALLATGRRDAAEAILKAVVTDHPGSPAADDARRELTAIGR